MNDLLSVVAKVSALLAGLDPDARAKALSLLLQATESTEAHRKRIARDRRRRQRDKYGTDAGQVSDSGETATGQQQDNNRTSVGLGGKGGSQISDLGLSVSHQGSTLKQSSPEGGPSQTLEAGERSLPEGAGVRLPQRAGGPTLSPGGGSKEPGNSPSPPKGELRERLGVRPQECPEDNASETQNGVTGGERPAFTAGEAAPGPAAVTCPANGEGGPVARVASGELAPSHESTSTTSGRERPAAFAAPGKRSARSPEPERVPDDSGALPTKRYNPAALVEHFVAGVNAAGGVWTCPSGKPFTDLAAALQPHATPTTTAKLLGSRWFAYCGGAPRDAWKAAAWLGEGAPERPRGAEASEAQERAARARRADEAKARERDEERKRREEARAPPPPEVASLFAAKPMSETRVKSVAEQAAELEKMAGE